MEYESATPLDLNRPGIAGWTALSRAACNGCENVVKLLLAHSHADGASLPALDTNRGDSNGVTALMHAAANTQVAVVKLLLAHEGSAASRIDVNRADTQGATALSKACAAGDVDVVQALLAYDRRPRIDINKRRSNGDTPFFAACRSNTAAAVQALVEHGADLERRGIRRNRGRDLIDINAPMSGMDGSTALYNACFAGATEVVEKLLTYPGLDVNKAEAGDGNTPLYAACWQKHAAIVRLLLAAEAIDVNKARSSDGEHPLYIACYQGDAQIVVDLLSHKDIDVNQVEKQSTNSPFYAACWFGHTEVVVAMLKDYAEKKETGTVPEVALLNFQKGRRVDGETPLQIACQQGHLQIVAELVAFVDGGHINEISKEGETVLYSMCWASKHECVGMLVQHPEIDMNQPATLDGNTPHAGRMPAPRLHGGSGFDQR